MHPCPRIVAVSSLIIAFNNLLLAKAFPLLSTQHGIIQRRSSPTQKTTVFSSTFEDDDFFDVEAARQDLEALVGGGGLPVAREQQQQAQSTKRPESVAQKSRLLPSYPTLDTYLPAAPKVEIFVPPAPPLTTIERARRMAEMNLMSELAHGDESLSDIWSLWFSERGSQAERLLKRSDELMNEGPGGWRESEDILRQLVAEYGVYFVEPINRLATLYYLQGRLEEAELFCKTALAVKPWHFGALSTIVNVYADLGDAENARRWAAHRLPNFASSGPNKRRARWVHRAVLNSRTAFEEAEHRILESFGKSDDEWIALQQQGQTQISDATDSWQ